MRYSFTTPSPARSSLNPQPLIHLPNAPLEHTPVRVLQEALCQKQRRKKKQSKATKNKLWKKTPEFKGFNLPKMPILNSGPETIWGFWFTFVGCGNVYIISPQWNQWNPYQISGHLRLGYVRLITHNLWYQSFAFIWTEDFGNPGVWKVWSCGFFPPSVGPTKLLFWNIPPQPSFESTHPSNMKKP